MTMMKRAFIFLSLLLSVTPAFAAQTQIARTHAAMSVATTPAPLVSSEAPGAVITEYGSATGQGTDLPTGLELNGSIGSIGALRVMRNQDAFVYVQGYFSAGDGGEGFLTVNATDTSSADNGCSIFVDGQGRRWYRSNAHALSVKQCGAFGDNTHNDMTAFRNWWSALMAQGGGTGIIPAGHYKLSGGPLVLDFANNGSNGVHVTGAGPRDTVLDLSSDTTANLRIVNSGNSAFYFGIFDNMQIIASYAGAAVALGQDSFADTLNGFAFRDMVINNTNATNSAIGLKLNAVNGSTFSNLAINNACADAQGNCTTYGEAVELDHASHNELNFTAGNATLGLRLTNGVSTGNVFNALDIEPVLTDVAIDSANATSNSWVGGTFLNYHFYNNAAPNSYTVAGLSGASNIFENPNMDALDVTLNASSGVQINSNRYAIAVPAVPLSGNAVVNTSGRRVQVVISGGILSQVCFGPNSATCQAQNNANTGLVTLTLLPGDSITPSYTGTIIWSWTPVS